MKQQVKQLIDRLGSNNIRFEDVLDVIFQEHKDYTAIYASSNELSCNDFVREIKQLDLLLPMFLKWHKCGIKTSLNELYAEEWEESECIDSNCKCGSFPLRNDNCEFKATPKNPNIKALFQFLLELNI